MSTTDRPDGEDPFLRVRDTKSGIVTIERRSVVESYGDDIYEVITEDEDERPLVNHNGDPVGPEFPEPAAAEQPEQQPEQLDGQAQSADQAGGAQSEEQPAQPQVEPGAQAATAATAPAPTPAPTPAPSPPPSGRAGRQRLSDTTTSGTSNPPQPGGQSDAADTPTPKEA